MSDTVSPLKQKVKLGDNKHSKRRSSDDISKYEKPLPFHLDDFMNQYLSMKENPATQDPMITEMAAHIQGMIRDHWPSSSKTRIAFQSMEKHVVWDNEEAKIMRLTKRNLATLSGRFIPELDDYCHTMYSDIIDPLREKIRAIWVALYSTDEEIAEIEGIIDSLGPIPVAHQYANLAIHRDLLETSMHEMTCKFPVIEYGRSRELFVMHLVNWESAHKEMAKIEARGTDDLLNWIAKFRFSAINLIIASNKKMRSMVGQYQNETRRGKTFQMMGKEYVPLFLEKQEAQIAKVKTNFSYFTLDILYFDNPRGGADCNVIVPRVLDPCIEADCHESGALDIPEPPEMPVFAAEVGFLFQYY